jgi:hypothetical protein
MGSEDLTTIEEFGGHLYATAPAYIVENVDQLPREIASEVSKEDLNRKFIWIAGRYVQANNPNKNGHYWTFDDLQKGEASIRYTPLNVLHKYEKPVGTIVQTKIVQRQEASTQRILPEVQALSVFWAFNFPELGELIRAAHEAKQLWYSMECVSESKQCMACEEVFPYAAAAHEVCEHLASSAAAPRRFINPTFLGGALIFPPERPAWPDADITEVARELTRQYAARATQKGMTGLEWAEMMDMATRWA